MNTIQYNTIHGLTCTKIRVLFVFKSSKDETPPLVFSILGEAARRAYPVMARYVEFLLRHTSPDDGLLRFGMLGDWNPLKYDGDPNTRRLEDPRTPVPQVSAFYGALCVGMTAEVAAGLGYSADAQRYEGRAKAMRLAYHTAFFNAAS